MNVKTGKGVKRDRIILFYILKAREENKHKTQAKF